jgi:GntR family transcriptional regulator
MLKIKYNSPVPIYEQLIAEIERMLSISELKPGDELPSIRSLASQLEISNNTVARAYMELERKGMVTSNGRKGTFINEFYQHSDKGNNDKVFKNSILDLIRKGMDEAAIRQAFEKNMIEIFK